MKGQLFVDSLKALISNFETSVIKLINRKSPLSSKMEDLSLNLLSFKLDLLRNICSILKQQSDRQMIQKIENQFSQNRQKLKKLELHAFLLKKIKKIKKQSMIHSITEQSFSSSILQDPSIAKLRNSVVLIEKDLGITEQYDHYQQQISSVIHKSMNSLQVTPIKKNFDLNTSDVSIKIQDSQISLPDQQNNMQKVLSSKNKLNKQKQKLKQSQIKNQNLQAPKLQTKKKKTVDKTKTTKGGMLDNLLQESLESYVMSGDKK